MKKTKNTCYVDNPFQSPAVLSLCPGFLGLERGLQRAIGKIRVIAYVEIEAFIVANLIAGMQAGVVDAAPVWTDVKTFNAKPFYKKIHGIMGGYPCQPFSTAGKRKGKNDPRHLWPAIHGIIQTTRPVWCFFENVSGHITMGFDQVYKDLRDLGYSVEAGLFTAEESGAPHKRERLFILAINQQFLAHNHIKYDDWVRKFWPGRRFEDSNRREYYRQISDTGGTDVQRGDGIQESAGRPEFTNSDCQSESKVSLRLRPYLDNIREFLFNRTLPQLQTDNRWGSNIFNGWPAGPRQPQHDWEEKRTIEPGLGSTINGYNFREDLLRAYGNSVVEQTAEIAFIDLLQKHIKNISLAQNK